MPRESTFNTRQSRPADSFKCVAIIMEGEKQEPNYFKALKDYYALQLRESRVIVEIVERELGDGRGAPQHLIKRSQETAEKYQLQEYDETWIVFDADSWQNRTLDELRNWKNQKNNHHLAYSNPCFELWLILHLTEYQIVKNEIESAKIRERSQSCKKLLSDLKNEHKLSGHHNQYMIAIQEAIARAEVLDVNKEEDFPQNICTRVYRLAEKLTTLPKKYVFFNPDSCHNEKEVETKFIASYLLPMLGYRAEDWQQQARYNRLRLDFIVNQLVIETKHPGNVLTDAHVQQLTEYMKVANLRYGILTNAKELRIYEQVNQKYVLVFRCFVKGIEGRITEISRLVGRDILAENHDKIEQISLPKKSENNEMKVIAIYHNKGGVGKTTVAVNLAAAFRNMGKRVLLIDIDAQANATFATGLIKFLFDEQDDLRESNVFNLLEDSERGFIPELRRSSKDFNAPEIDVIPSHITLIDKQDRLTKFANTRWRLNNKIQQIKQDYDVVIIDAPPSRDIYAEIALIAADYLIVPSDLKPFANQGLPNVRSFIKQVDETRISIGKDTLKTIGVLPSKILTNPKYLKHTFEQQKRHVVDYYHFAVMNSKILDRKGLADCFNQDIEMGELRIPDPKSIFMFDKNSESTKEFIELAHEVLKEIGVIQ